MSSTQLALYIGLHPQNLRVMSGEVYPSQPLQSARKKMKTLLSKVIIETKDEQNIQKTFYGEDARDKAIDYAKQIKNPETAWIETVEKI